MPKRPTPTGGHFQQRQVQLNRIFSKRAQPERDFSGRAERGAMKPTCMIVEQCEDDGGPPVWPKQEHRLENPMLSARGVLTKVT